MTVIRWTEPASADFLGIVEWLNDRSPTAAARVGRTILTAIEQLENFPLLGKPGRSSDTRELGIPRFPYLVVYSVEPATIAADPARVAILRVLHGRILMLSHISQS